MRFALFTTKGLNIETITFDDSFWSNELLPALKSFYQNCVAPEIVCPMHLETIILSCLKHSLFVSKCRREAAK